VHHGAGMKVHTHVGAHPRHGVALEDQVIHRLLEQGQVRLVLHHGADCGLVAHAVSLRTGRTHRRPLAGVEDAELDAAQVRRPGHGPA